MADLRPNEQLNRQAGDVKGTFAIVSILHLGVMINGEMQICSGLKDFILDLYPRRIRELAETLDLSRMQILLDGEDDLTEEELLNEFGWTCVAQNKFGYLCEVRAPEVTNLGNGTKTIRYGLQRMRWFYAEDLAGIIEQADRWATSLERSSLDKLPRRGKVRT